MWTLLLLILIESRPHAPWGWNSYDFVRGYINETGLLAVIDGFVEELQPYGFEYINLDEGWNQKDPWECDQWGRPTFNPDHWPRAAKAGTMKVYADIIHSKGLKFGMYWTRGINSHFVNHTIKGTNVPLKDIVCYTKHCNCPWGGGDLWLGVDQGASGAQEYYTSIIELFVSWGVDMLKMDCIEFNRDDIRMLLNGIHQFNNSILLSLSPGGKFERGWGDEIVSRYHPVQYRIVNDFNGGWGEMPRNLHQAEAFMSIIGLNDSWPDLDMIPFGSVGCDANGENCHGGHAHPEEIEWFMTAYMMAKSPLLFGGKLPDQSKFVELYLQKPVALAVNANSTNNRVLLSNWTHVSVWTADMISCPALDKSRPCIVLGVFNCQEDWLRQHTVILNTTFSSKYNVWNETIATFAPTKQITFDVNYHNAAFVLLQ